MSKKKSEKKWFRPTYPVAPPDALGSWRAAEADKKKKKPKPNELKPFTVRHYRFFPINWPHLKSAGFIYYLVTMNYRGVIHQEVNCPLFKSREEAVDFASRNLLKGRLPG